MKHSHHMKNTTHQCGTLVFGTDPAHLGARSALPHARRRESLRRRRVVLPVVRGRQSGAHDRRAGAAGGRPHHDFRRRCNESALVQPRRHHGLGLQPRRALLLGGVRLPAGRRRRHAAGARARVFRRRRSAAAMQDRLDPGAGRRRARDLRVPAAAAAVEDSVEPRRADPLLVQRAESRRSGTTTCRRRASSASAGPSGRREATRSSSSGISTAT